MLETGVRILRLLTAAVTLEPLSALPVHAQLAAAWTVPAGEAALIRAALVLSADHEFNASTFAARVVASTGANLHGSVIGGLAAINGPRHGGLTRRVTALFDSLKAEPDLEATLRQRLAEGHDLPGFGHPLYPDGDVRAATLLEMLRETVANAPEAAFAERVAEAGEHLTAGDVPARPHRRLDRARYRTVGRQLDPPARAVYGTSTHHVRFPRGCQ
jgi:citrate synthase